MSPITVLGAGSWGTTMAQVLADAGNDVLIWGRNANLVGEINTIHTQLEIFAKYCTSNAATRYWRY
jgi:glycerol-3-phosphate dehydrogenase (NAD(P)+)